MNEEPVKPNLFRGQPIRLLDLTSDAFEDFVYATMSEWGPLQGFRVTSGPSESSDSGFDVTGERQGDGKSVCIQCKRLTGTFHLNSIGSELAKVALKTALEGAQVVEHFVITTGSVGETLRSALRSKPRTTLAKAAADAAEKHADLATLRSKARERGFNVRDIVEKYVLQLERLRVWSGRDFDQELGRVWSKIIPFLERFFQVEIVLREYPRPDFDRAQYLQSLAAESPSDLIRLRAVLTDLPPNVVRTRGEDPLAEGRDSRDGDPKEKEGVLDVVTTLIQTPLKTCTILHGKGGSGKTTTLKLVLGAVAAEPSTCDDAPLPVFVRLSSYQGRLQDQIHAALHITHGTWTSLPGPFLLLLDGLDEMPTAQVQPLLDELDLVLRDEFAACVLTIRGAGLRTPACLTRARTCLRILPLTLREVIDIAKSRIPSDQRESFLTQLRSRLRALWPSLLFLPFGYLAAISIFLKTGTLPSTSEELIEGILKGRFKRNRLRSHSMEERLHAVPDAVVRGLAEAIAFAFRIEVQRTSVSVQEAHEMVARSLALVKSENRFGVSMLSDLDALVLLKNYEFLEPTPDGRMGMPHDIVADFLASPRLAANWERYVDRLESTIGQDAWSYASILIPLEQQAAFLEPIAAADLIQAASCAAAMGGHAPELIEPLALALDDLKARLPIFQAASCMGILGTPACLTRLRDRVRREPNGSIRKYQAERALAQRGDDATLRVILANQEPSVSTGLKVSGGELDLWFQAPPDITLSLARQRLDTVPVNPSVVLSLRTIHLYGDDTDFVRVSSALEQTSNLAAFYAASHCLLALDRQHAVELLTSRAVLLPAVEQLPYAEVLSTAKAPLDTSPLLDELLNGPGPSNESAAGIRRRILEIVKKERLPDGYEPRIRAAFEKADEYQQSDLWQVATAHRLRAFDDLAIAALSRGGMNEVGCAANFAKARGWEADISDRFAALCLERAGTADGTEWYFPRVLEYLLQVGKESQVVALLEPLLRDLLPRHKAARRRFNKKALSRRRTGANGPVDMEEFRLSVSVPELVKIAATLSGYIPRDVAREIVGLDLSFSNDDVKNARCSIARCLPAGDIDEALMQIDEPDVRIQVLGGISDLGATPTRIEVLCQELPKVLCWHAYGLVRAVDNLWSRRVAEASVNAVATMKWPEYGSQLAHEFVDVVAHRMTSELASAVVLPQIETTKDTDSREILQYWYDIGTLARR
jgi:hypothetical protein